MKGVIFSQTESESTDILVEYFNKSGIEIDQFFLLEDTLEEETGMLFSKKNDRWFPISKYNFCYGRTWGDYTSRRILHNWLKYFTRHKIPSLDSLEGVLQADSKIHMMRTFIKKGVPIPDTICFDVSTPLKEILEKTKRHFDSQIVIKADGSQGKHVHFTDKDNRVSMRKILTPYSSENHLKQPIIIQEYIPSKNLEEHSYHYRALLAGGELTSLFRFTAPNKGILKSNMIFGGSVELVSTRQLTFYQKAILKKACETLGINIAGVDFLHQNGQIYILEVNNSPGLMPAYELGEKVAFEAIVEFSKCLTRN